MRRLIPMSVLILVAVPLLWLASQINREQELTEDRRNLLLIATAIARYVDLRGAMPPMETPVITRQALATCDPTMENEGFFTEPGTGLNYLPNPSLSRCSTAKLKQMGKVLAIIEPRPYKPHKWRVVWITEYEFGPHWEVGSVDHIPEAFRFDQRL